MKLDCQAPNYLLRSSLPAKDDAVVSLSPDPLPLTPLPGTLLRPSSRMGKTVNMTNKSSSKRSLRNLPRLSGGAALLLALLLVSTLLLAQRLSAFHTLPHDLAVTPADHTTIGADAIDRLGSDVAVGDFNGDGIDDVLVSADFADGIGNAKSSAGEAYVIFGSAAFGGVTDLSINSSRPTDRRGGRVRFTISRGRHRRRQRRLLGWRWTRLRRRHNLPRRSRDC